MMRSSFVLVLLQGGFFAVLATNLVVTASDEQPLPTQEEGSLPSYNLTNAAGQPCVMIEMDAHISFKWEVGNNNSKEVDTYVEPNNVKTTGFCKTEDVQLLLTWKSVQLKWSFSKTRDSVKWFAKEVELQFNKTEIIQNNVSGPSKVSTWRSTDVFLFSAPMGKAYHCSDEYSLQLNSTGIDSATLLLRRFRVQPFLTDKSFGPSYCPTNNKTDKVVGSPTTLTSSPSEADSMADEIHGSSEISTRVSDSSEGPVSSSSLAATEESGRNTQNPIHSTEAPLDESSGADFTTILPERLVHDKHDSMTTSHFMKSDPSVTTQSVTPLPSFVYQKTLPYTMKMPVYPSKKMFHTGLKMGNNDALSAMLWSWYSSGFYTGYYQALQVSKNTV